MTYRSPERLFCPDCQGLLTYYRIKYDRRDVGEVIAVHSINGHPSGKRISTTRLPHTKRTLDRARREARCHVREGGDVA